MERRIKVKQPDTGSIDIEDYYALEYWARELSVSPKKLKIAVLAVGNSVVDVKRALKSI
jgi:hypothetical protein